MKWNVLVLIGAMFVFILYWVTRHRPIDMAEQKALAPFYMSYNQPVRDNGQGGSGFKIPDPFDYRGNGRKCLGCDPEKSEIMAGKARIANDEATKREQDVQDYINDMNEYMGEIFGGFA